MTEKIWIALTTAVTAEHLDGNSIQKKLNHRMKNMNLTMHFLIPNLAVERCTIRPVTCEKRVLVVEGLSGK